jgi:hypothetical protein
MPAQRVHAVVRTLAGALVALAFLAPSASAQSAMSANDDTINAEPTGVADVLANDSSSPSQAFTIVSNTQPANGTVTCSTLGACFYRANPGFTGNDAFTYTARNEAGALDTATVSVGVRGSTASTALIARDDDLATLQNNAKSLNVMANDTGEGITLVDNGEPQHGTVSCQGDGTCTYTPAAGYTGSDGFVYTIRESGGNSRQASGTNGSGREATAAVHILVAPGDTGHRLAVGGSPQSPSNGAIPPGGKADWALGVFPVPEGISGQELGAIARPEGTASLSGPHALESGSLKSAKGWTAGVGGDGRSLSYQAGDGALLGEAHTQTFPRPLPPISQGTGGDGHVPILVGSKVFAFYHHTHPTSATCVDRRTGAVCPGYPKRLTNLGSTEGFHSTDNNGPGVVQGTKIWTHLYVPASQRASVGLFCWDESTDSTCGYTIVARAASSFMDASAPVRGADGNAWFASGNTAYCVEPASGATCGSVAIPLPASSSAMDAIGHGKYAYFSREATPGQGEGRVTCVDTAARTLCNGWSQAQNFGSGQWNLVNRHATNGAVNGICVFNGPNGMCMPDENPAAATSVDNFVHSDSHYSGSLEAEFGTRTLVGSLSVDGAGCYDWSVPVGGNPGSPCTGGDYGNGGRAGWISRQSDGSAFPRSGAYGLISDGSCAIALGDAGQVYTVDPAGTAPCVSLGSGTDRTTIDLRDQRCDRTVGAAAWRSVVLSDTNGDEMESVVVTVRDAQTGEVLKSGEMVGGSQTLDLSDVDAQQHPSIAIDATARSKGGNGAWDDGIPPRLRLTWKSDPKTVCLTSVGDNGCGSNPATVTVAGALANGAGGEAHLSLLRNACAGGVAGQQARSCTSKRRVLMTLRIEKELRKLKAKKSAVKSVRVTVNGKRAKVFKRGGRWRARADLRRLKKGRYVVRITVTLKNGKKLTGVRRYRTCRDAISGGPPRL